MNDTTILITPGQVQRHYDAAMDSVNLINAGQPVGMTDEDWADTVKRNVDHLEVMLAKDFWTEDQDLTPLEGAVEQ
jgi:hypothetical protein